MRRRSVFALVGVGVGAVVLAGGGYAAGAGHDGRGSDASGRVHLDCRQVGGDFTKRAGQLRAQLAAEAGSTDGQELPFEIDRMQAAVLATMVAENPGCFDAGTRATVSVLQRHTADGIGDAATCQLVGRPLDECSVQSSS